MTNIHTELPILLVSGIIITVLAIGIVLLEIDLQWGKIK